MNINTANTYTALVPHKSKLGENPIPYPFENNWINILMENTEEKLRPGPKPKTLTEGTIEGIPCGWNKTIIPPDQVYELAVLGLTNKEIGNFYNVSDATISRNFVAELQKGREMTKIRLRRNLMKAADNLQPAVLIFLAKSVLGMTETQPENKEPLPWVENENNTEKELDAENEN